MRIDTPPAVRCRLLGTVDVRNAAGEDVRTLLVQPKRLALFAYLVLRGPGRLARRDTVLALFWPEATADAARHSLRQALHALRQELGPDVLVRRGRDEIGVTADRVWCDAAEFERAATAGRHADALALYGGSLLDGVHAAGVAPELGQWIDEERGRLHALALRCAQALVDEAERAGNLPLAARSARDAVRLAPYDEAEVRRLMTLLHASGDRAGALRAYDTFAARLASELEMAPSAETQALAALVRRDTDVRAHGVRADAPERVLGEPTAPLGSAATEVVGADAEDLRSGQVAHGQPHRARRAPPLLAALALAALVVLTAAAVIARGHAPAPEPAVLAVGTLRVQTRDTSLSPRLVRELLATDLAQLQRVDVVSAERMDELLARARAERGDTGGGDTGGGDTERGDTVSVSDVARRAGATVVIEGILSGGEGHALRLDVRLVDPVRGVIRGARVVEAPDLFTLADTVTAWVAAGVARGAPATPLAEVTSASLVAHRFYDEGLRALNQGDEPAALRLFRAALAEDSTYAMAAYQAGVTALDVDGSAAALPLMARALRLTRRAPERERLFVAAHWAAVANSPSAVPIAESLATRYPLEPDADLSFGESLLWAGDRGRAIPRLRRVVERDAAMLDVAAGDTARQRLPCRACAALRSVIAAYVDGDSLDFAEREARDWTRRQPANALGWSALAEVYERQGRFAEALAAQRERSRRAGRDLADATYRARLAIRAGDFATADRLLRDGAAAGDPRTRVEALWWQTISFRQQARFGLALLAADRAISVEDSIARPVDRASAPRMARAQVLLELGRAREAAAAFEAMAVVPVAYPGSPPLVMPGLGARRKAWCLTLAATARAAAGDTASLATLGDSVAASGERSGFGRDRRLASYVRGLLLEARHDDAAAESAFRAALYSPTDGYTRVNLALARVLLAERRTRDAVPVLRAALRGPLDGSNYYVTRTELQAALARAFTAAGQQDSARVYRTRVAVAMAHADRPHRSRARDLSTATARRRFLPTRGSAQRVGLEFQSARRQRG